jgi:hypothetical protein
MYSCLFRRGRDAKPTKERGEHDLSYANCVAAGLGKHRRKSFGPGGVLMVLGSLGETKGSWVQKKSSKHKKVPDTFS